MGKEPGHGSNYELFGNLLFPSCGVHQLWGVSSCEDLEVPSITTRTDCFLQIIYPCNSSFVCVVPHFSEQYQAKGKLPCQPVNLSPNFLARALILRLYMRLYLRKSHWFLGSTHMDIILILPDPGWFAHHHCYITSSTLFFQIFIISHFHWKKVLCLHLSFFSCCFRRS